MKLTLPVVRFDTAIVLLLLLGSTLLCLSAERQIFRWPMSAEFPAVIRSLDAGALPTDFYTNAVTDSPKTMFGHAIAWLSRINGDWYSTLTLLHVVVQVTLRPLIYLFLVGLGAWWKIADSRPWRWIRAGAAALLLVHHFAAVRILLAGWDSFLSLPLSNPMILAIWLGLISACLLVRARRVTAAALLVQLFAAVTHPVLGLCCWAVWGALLLPRADAKFARSFLVLGVLGGVLPALAISRGFAPHQPLSAADYVAGYVMDRHPHHYRMSTSICPGFWQLAALWIVPVGVSLGLSWRHRILAVVTLAVMGGAVIVQYLGTEVVPVKVIAEFGPARMTCLMVMLWILVTAIVAGSRWPGRVGAAEWVAEAGERRIRRRARWGIAAGTALAIAVLFWFTPRDPWWKAREAQAVPVLEWIRDHTAPTDAILEGSDDFDSFWIRILARRPVVADDAFPFTDDAMPEFFARRKLLRAFQQDPVGLLSGAPPAVPCDFVILPRSRLPAAMAVAFETAEWVVIPCPWRGRQKL